MAEGVSPRIVWGRKVTEDQQPEQPIVSFVEIMEEQEHENEIDKIQTLASIEIAENSQHQISCDNLDCSRDHLIALELSRDPDCSADQLLAIKLQREFDREYELNQKFEQSRAITGKATAVLASDTISSRQLCEKRATESSDEEYATDDDEMREFATNLLYEKHEQELEFPPCGFLQMQDGTYVTKHDQDLDERKNSDKMMQLPLELPTGDVAEHRIGRRIYNDLRTFGKLESKRQMRLKDKEEKATSELSVDVKTRLILLKWINSAEIDRVEGIIATGKESAVLHAVSDGINSSDEKNINKEEIDDDEIHETGEVFNEMEHKLDEKFSNHITEQELQQTSKQIHFAIKVYKTTLAGFKNRSEYVKNDFRFKNPRRVMKIWAEKEFMNLQRLRRANIKCPMPIKLKKHILLMSMIGESVPAPKLRELDWNNEQMKIHAFAQVREIMQTMYKECHLVHGDLSEFNLLYDSGTVYVIDMAQAMDLSHPSALRFLHRDIVNILEFFGRIGCDPLPSAHTIFNEITGIEFDVNEDLYIQVETFERENRNMDIRAAKKNIANYELQKYNRESTGRADFPSRPYN